MSRIPTDPTLFFPHPLEYSHDGVIAYGGDLSVDRLLLAYRFGIFPWYNEDEPILWWFLNPRMILFPEQLKVSKSMRSYFNQKKYHVTIDNQFRRVIDNCKKVNRKGQKGTWIHQEMIAAYSDLHEQGIAHSVEVWEGDELVGGLYGIGIGKVFYGESMFAHKSNASKFGFITLVRLLKSKGYQAIDCQQATEHLASMGAKEVDGEVFFDILKENTKNPDLFQKWTDWAQDIID